MNHFLLTKCNDREGVMMTRFIQALQSRSFPSLTNYRRENRIQPLGGKSCYYNKSGKEQLYPQQRLIEGDIHEFK